MSCCDKACYHRTKESAPWDQKKGYREFKAVCCNCRTERTEKDHTEPVPIFGQLHKQGK